MQKSLLLLKLREMQGLIPGWGNLAPLKSVYSIGLQQLRFVSWWSTFRLSGIHCLSVLLKASPPVSVHINYILQLNNPPSINTTFEIEPCEAQLNQTGQDTERGGNISSRGRAHVGTHWRNRGINAMLNLSRAVYLMSPKVFLS